MHEGTVDHWTAFRNDPCEKSFRPYYESTKRLVWTLCLRILRDREEALEAFQAVYCRVLALAREPAGESGDQGSGDQLYRIALREAGRLRKRRSRRRAREVPMEEAPPVKDRQEPVGEAVAREEIRDRVETLVAGLPEVYRLPVQLHYFHGLSQREVASALGQPLSTVSDRLRGALRKLDPAFRRIGLGRAGATLAGLGAGGALLDPPLSAAVVFTRAEAMLAAAGPAGLGASSVFIKTLTGGILLMKTKAALTAALFLLALTGLSIQWRLRDPGPAAGPAAAGPGRKADRAGGGEGAAAAPGAEAAGAARQLIRETVAQVLWSDTGEPASGAQVVLFPEKGDRSSQVEARSDDGGRAVLHPPAGWASGWLEARHPEGAGEGIELVLPATGTVRVTLVRDVITGLVADASSGEPLPGAVVRARLGNQEAVADAAGVYRLAGTGKGVHDLIASAEGHADQPAQVSHAGGSSIQDFLLDPAAAVAITVLDDEGAPVPGARISRSLPGSEGVYHDAGLKTDREGRAIVSSVSRLRPPTIGASKEGYRSAYAKPRVDDRGELAEELEITIPRVREELRVITGRVRDPRGRPIPDITVEWKDGQGTSFGAGVEYGQWKAFTDRDGFYRLEYTDDYDRCSLGVAGKGWAPVVAEGVQAGTPARPAEKDFTLEPAHWLAGRVLDEGGRPVAGVRIHAMPRKGLLNAAVAYPAVLRRTETDADGRFRLEDLSGPTVALMLRGSGPSQDEEVAVDQEVELVLKGWGSIAGQVVDGSSGEPVTLFNIKLRGSGVGVEEMKTGKTFTSQEGRFLLERLERGGKYTLVIQAEGYRLAEVEDLVPGGGGDSRLVRVALERGEPVAGVVVDASSGAPLAAVQVGFTSFEGARELMAKEWEPFWGLKDFQWVLTGPEGAFQFPEGKPASLLVRARGHRRLFITPAERAAYQGPGGRLRIPLERGESLSGVFVQDGAPVQGAAVRLDLLKGLDLLEGRARPAKGGEDTAHGFVKTGPEGAFRWDDLAPGPYLLSVERGTGDAKPEKVEIRRRVMVRAGEEAVADLGRDLGSITLRGRLTGLETRETVWAGVTFKPASGGDQGELFQKTYRDWGWRLAFPYLRPGKYAVEVEYYTREGNRTVSLKPIEVSGDQEVELEVPED